MPQPKKDTDAVTTWRATHTLLLSNSSPTGDIFSDPVTVNQLQLFATVGEVPKRAAERIGYRGEPAALAAQVSIQVFQQTGAIQITTQQSTAEQAVAVADTFAEELTTYLAERQDSLKTLRITSSLAEVSKLEDELKDLQRRVTASPDDAVLKAQLDALSREYSVAYEQYRQLQVDRGQLQLTTLERAQAIAITDRGLGAPRSRTSRGLLGLAVGALLGLGAAVALARADRRIRTRAQAESLFGMRSQVSIPATKDHPGNIVVRPDRHEPLSDAYRTLRSVIGFVEGGAARRDGRVPIVMVVSASAGDGKTSVASNLAAAFVESRTPTVAVNADFRRPALTQRITGRRPEEMGFSAAEVATMPISALLTRTPIEGLVVLDLVGNQGSPGELARSTAALLPTLSGTPAGVVIIDTSPVSITAEVLELVPRADVIVLVARLDHTYVDAAQRTIETLRAIGTVEPLLVLVGEKVAHSDYDEYAGRLDDRTPRPARRKG